MSNLNHKCRSSATRTLVPASPPTENLVAVAAWPANCRSASGPWDAASGWWFLKTPDRTKVSRLVGNDVLDIQIPVVETDKRNVSEIFPPLVTVTAVVERVVAPRL